ncbi:hypothetical protein K7W42_07580 [Deinococcus sp. HMF7604]|uniref:hypothetical protein n=1 Tax=Deinococcus betulae TaxID=2873312 RepID=UPI001CCD443E|nr:hypothetical protein [Deinococcus betulae]MBZ9750719.1 hypothetical protein [Deinococcus betulae]
MSRGRGRVMRGVLGALGGPVKLSTPEICGAVFPHGGTAAHLSSVRRALRVLHAEGVVCCLGADLGGFKVWCLRSRRHLLDAYGQPHGGVTLGELLGTRGNWVTRALLSSR